MRGFRRGLLVVSSAVPVGLIASTRQTNERGYAFAQANYTKHEYRIAMRDGVKLYTNVYVPRDTTRTYPILLKRTPYSCRPYGSDSYATLIGPSRYVDEEGYIIA